MEHDDNVILFAPFGGAAPDPELFLAGVLDGWERQQRSKDFSPGTIRTRRALVLKLVDFSGHYPWEWTFADVDDFFAHARGVRNLSHATVRSYQTSIKLFCDYACDPRYDWNEQSGRLFGQLFSQVVTEFNRVSHSLPSEARPVKRPFTPRELQELFDLADLEVTRILDSGRRSPVAAWRDAVAFKTAYGWVFDPMSCGICSSSICPAIIGPRTSASTGCCGCGGASPIAARRRRSAPS